MCGVVLLLARLLKLGFIANFLSRSVLIGFLTGVGIQVAMGQVAGMFGITPAAARPSRSSPTAPGDRGRRHRLRDPRRLGRGPRHHPRPRARQQEDPGRAHRGRRLDRAELCLLDLAAKGVTTLGTIQGGLPTIGLPQDVITTANIVALLPMVISLFVVILAQSAATSRAYAMKYGDSFEENVDLVGLGLASLGAGISGTFPVNGSPTKTEMVDSAGGRSQISQLTAGAIVVVVLLFLTGPLPTCRTRSSRRSSS